MAHVFGDHAPIRLGGFTVPAHRPRDGAGTARTIRVLFAKDAILDWLGLPTCRGAGVRSVPPRTRPTSPNSSARMVRTPLARRVPGNDLLNSVECVLPHFDRSTAARVREDHARRPRA